MRNGRQVYVPPEKVRKTNANKHPPKPSIPPVEVADLPPPLFQTKHLVMHLMFLGQWNGNPDGVPLVHVCVALGDDQFEGGELEPHV